MEPEKVIRIGMVFVLLMLGLCCLATALLGATGAFSIPIAPTAPRFSSSPSSTESGSASSEFELHITIENKSLDEICAVYSSKIGRGDWINRLGSGESIAPGEAKNIGVSKGIHDLLVHNCDDIPIAKATDIETDTTVTVGGADRVEFTLINDEDEPLCLFYISSASEGAWGESWLALNEEIPTGEKRIFYLEPGSYDFRAHGCENAEVTEVFDVQIDKSRTWRMSEKDENATAPAPFELTVSNRTEFPICYLYIAPDESRKWGDNRLGTLLPKNRDQTFELPGETHNVFVTDCNLNAVGVVMGVKRNYQLTVGKEGEVSNLTVSNESGKDICYLFFTQDQQQNDNVLKNWITFQDESKWIFFLDPGIYRLKALDCNGRVIKQANSFDLSRDATWKITD